jgi:hypothetical protein
MERLARSIPYSVAEHLMLSLFGYPLSEGSHVLLISSVGEFVYPGIGSCCRTSTFPTPRVPPFLGSPAFYWYYVDAKTPYPPALARTYLASQSRGAGFVFIDPIGSRPTRCDRGRWFPVSPFSGVGSLVWYGYPVFHGLPFDGLPCSSTPPGPLDLASRSFGCCPRSVPTAKTPGM